MIILKLNENNELIASINGKEEEFYRTVNYLKNMNGARFDRENKVWVLPRSMKTINDLKKNFLVGSSYDFYELAGVKAPRVDNALDIFLEEINGDINGFIKEFQIDTLKLGLKDFQKLGVSLALYFLLKDNGFLIADEMGLGKTVQALAVANSMKRLGYIERVLVVCPKNVKLQWGYEIETFTDFSYIVVDGYNKDKRLSCYELDKEIYIINHDLLINEDDYEKIVHDVQPDLVIVDEIHYFKSHSAKRTKKLKRLDVKYRLGLTGTPMQNKPEDIHSIFEFLIPDYLGKYKDFRKQYILYDFRRFYPIGYRNLFELKTKVGQRIIRRRTEDISEELPTPHFKTHRVQMDSLQVLAHDRVQEMIDETKEKINKTDNEEEIEELSGKIMGLYTVQAAISDDLRILMLSEKKWIRNLAPVSMSYQSNKMKKLKKLVTDILNYNKDFKIVIFSQFARMVNLIRQDLIQSNIAKNVATIFGELDENERFNEIQKFLNNKDCRIIVMSDAGAVGYNLQVASHLINYDIPWNPAILDQRNGRIRRIGSPWKNIYISNLISIDSIDEKIDDTIIKKRGYFDTIVENAEEEIIAMQEFLEKIL